MGRAVLHLHCVRQDLRDLLGERSPVEAGSLLELAVQGVRDLRELQEISAAAAFAEVSRAKLHHNGNIGVNVLMKVATQIPPTIYGAMLAGVDYVIAGAGSPA